jgi:competence protein ComGF
MQQNFIALAYIYSLSILHLDPLSLSLSLSLSLFLSLSLYTDLSHTHLWNFFTFDMGEEAQQVQLHIMSKSALIFLCLLGREQFFVPIFLEFRYRSRRERERERERERDLV